MSTGEGNNKITWPMVGMTAVAVGATIAVLTVLPASDARGGMVLTALLSLLGTVYGSHRATQRVERIVDDRLHTQNNRITVLVNERERRTERRSRSTEK